jgi:hypothetical protein
MLFHRSKIILGQIKNALTAQNRTTQGFQATCAISMLWIILGKPLKPLIHRPFRAAALKPRRGKAFKRIYNK